MNHTFFFSGYSSVPLTTALLHPFFRAGEMASRERGATFWPITDLLRTATPPTARYILCTLLVLGVAVMGGITNHIRGGWLDVSTIPDHETLFNRWNLILTFAAPHGIGSCAIQITAAVLHSLLLDVSAQEWCCFCSPAIGFSRSV
jgi:hypothetical protein